MKADPLPPPCRPLCMEQPSPESPGDVSPELVLTGMYGSAKTERKYLWPLSFTRSAWHDWGERDTGETVSAIPGRDFFFFLGCVNKRMCNEYFMP